MNESNYNMALDQFNNFRRSSREKYAAYFLGTQIGKIYNSAGWAKRYVTSMLYFPLGSIPHFEDYKARNQYVKKEREEIVNSMMKSGILEIRKLSDLSPRFPYNISYISKEQANKFRTMLDADKEMCNLAINILETLRKQENNET